MVFAISKVYMKTAIKIFCILASFTMFTLSTVGLEIEETEEICPEEQDVELISEVL
jgi:hypothetical protein